MYQEFGLVYLFTRYFVHIVCHGFGQAKFADGGSVFGLLEIIYTIAPAASENNIDLKKVKIDSKIIISLH